jgi:limonene-1,2-epoxide hydrolase
MENHGKGNLEIVTDFIKAWSRLDAHELVEYFTEDGVYYNMPAQPVQGRENLEKFISGFLANWTSTDWEILNSFGEGNVVVVERLDRTIAGEISVDLPCCGIFEMEAGKIKMWRDYFDMATFTRPFEKTGGTGG